MTAQQFSEALGNVDMRYVTEAINYNAVSRRRSWIIRVAAAACICIALLGAAFGTGQQIADNMAQEASKVLSATYVENLSHINGILWNGPMIGMVAPRQPGEVYLQIYFDQALADPMTAKVVADGVEYDLYSMKILTEEKQTVLVFSVPETDSVADYTLTIQFYTPEKKLVKYPLG